VSTASRVLSGSTHPVSQGARSRVLEAAETLSFEPNRLARALATARSKTIGVLVHDVSDPYFAEIIRGMEDVAGPREYALFVASSDRDRDKELALVRAFVAHRVDAIVLVASGLTTPGYLADLTSVLGRFEDRGGVVVSMSAHAYDAPRVTLDNAGAMATATRHLIDLGHRRIGYLSGPLDLSISDVRMQGYRRALEEAGIADDPSLVECGFFSIEGGAIATATLMDRASPTAIVCGNDLMAFGALRRLLDDKVRVPEQVSVIGFDDIEFAAYASVPLTTIRVPLTEMGRMATELVLELLGGGVPASLPTVAVGLVVRGSTAPVINPPIV
jgi:LacI family transcriptional regulator